MAIFDNVTDLADMLRIESETDYPHITGLLKPAAERVLREAVGVDWIAQHEDDEAVQAAACVLVAGWFLCPEATGEITPGANFLISQLQARALEGDDADGEDG